MIIIIKDVFLQYQPLLCALDYGLHCVPYYIECLISQLGRLDTYAATLYEFFISAPIRFVF